MSAIAKIYAELVKSGIKKIEEVPPRIRKEVETLLAKEN